MYVTYFIASIGKSQLQRPRGIHNECIQDLGYFLIFNNKDVVRIVKFRALGRIGVIAWLDGDQRHRCGDAGALCGLMNGQERCRVRSCQRSLLRVQKEALHSRIFFGISIDVGTNRRTHNDPAN